MLAQLTSWVANTGFRSTEKPTTWTDFSPSQWAKKAKPTASTPAKRLRMTKKRRLAIFDGLRSALAPVATITR